MGANWGQLLIRFGLGIVMVVHGAGKLFGVGPVAMPIGTFSTHLAGFGLPAPTALAWLVGVVEFGGGLLVIVGLLTRYAALAIAVSMLVATILVHLPKGFDHTEGGYEYTFVLFVMALALLVSGPGRLSVAHALFDGERFWPL